LLSFSIVSRECLLFLLTLSFGVRSVHEQRGVSRTLVESWPLSYPDLKHRVNVPFFVCFSHFSSQIFPAKSRVTVFSPLNPCLNNQVRSLRFLNFKNPPPCFTARLHLGPTRSETFPVSNRCPFLLCPRGSVSFHTGFRRQSIAYGSLPLCLGMLAARDPWHNFLLATQKPRDRGPE